MPCQPQASPPQSPSPAELERGTLIAGWDVFPFPGFAGEEAGGGAFRPYHTPGSLNLVHIGWWGGENNFSNGLSESPMHFYGDLILKRYPDHTGTKPVAVVSSGQRKDPYAPYPHLNPSRRVL